VELFNRELRTVLNTLMAVHAVHKLVLAKHASRNRIVEYRIAALTALLETLLKGDSEQGIHGILEKSPNNTRKLNGYRRKVGDWVDRISKAKGFIDMKVHQ
jgi:hypothetical protein